MRARGLVYVFLVAACGSPEGSGGSGSGEDPVVDEGRPAEKVSAAPARGDHPVFDLGANRLLAHAIRGGALRIEAGSAGFVKYLRLPFGGIAWKRGQEIEGERAAVPPNGTSLMVPLTAEQAAAGRIALRVHAGRADRITVSANGQDIGGQMLAVGWQTVDLPVAAGTLRAGLNEINMRRRDDIAIAWVEVGGAGDPAGPRARWDAGRFRLPDQTGLAWYVQVPAEAQLVGVVVGDGCRVDVSATPHQGEPLHGQLTASAPGVVDLAPLGGQVVRLQLVAGGCAETALAGAALTVPGAAPELKRGAPPKYVVWWVMDTLRGDRTRTVNPQARAEVPNLERLVAGGAGFRQFYVQGNESQTSHSSFWTAQYPANHHVITAGPRTNYQLAARFPQMGPVMTATGMRTIGVTSNGNIEQWTGYTRGFEEFENLMEDGTGKKLGFRVPASVVVDRVLEHLDDVSRPFFLFMGTTDTHKPWFARQPWIDRYHPEPYKGLFEDRVMSRWLGIPFGTHLCKEKLSAKDLKRIFAIYDSSISYQDDQLGRFIGELEKRGIADQTMIIVTADHGEELWEYPETCGHGSSLRESLVHVPLVLWYPPLVPAVGAVDEGVDGVDLLPTVLDAIGQPPLDSAQGESLLPLVNGVGRGYVRPSYASMNEHSHTLRLGRWKGWIGRTGRMALYDMETDRDERKDLAVERPLERQLVNDALALFVANRWKWKKREWGVASNMSAAAAEALEAR